MTLKLFNVRLTYDTIVVGEDADDAYFQTRDMTSDILCDATPEIEVGDQVKSIEELNADWDGAIPYGADGLKTCNEILELASEEKKVEVISSLSDAEKKHILSQMTLAEIVNLLNKVE